MPSSSSSTSRRWVAIITDIHLEDPTLSFYVGRKSTAFLGASCLVQNLILENNRFQQTDLNPGRGAVAEAQSPGGCGRVCRACCAGNVGLQKVARAQGGF